MAERITVQVPSDPVYLERIHDLGEAVLDPFPLSSKKRNHLLLAISEGFTNAYLHGNRREMGRRVFIEYELDETRVRVTIRDQGIHPVESDMNNLIREVGATEESGRGLGLISRLSDRASIRNEAGDGNILTIEVQMDRCEEHGNEEVTDGNQR